MIAALALDTRPVTLARVAVDARVTICLGLVPTFSYTARFESGEVVTIYEMGAEYQPIGRVNFTEIERAAITAIDLARLYWIKDRPLSITHLLAINCKRRELGALGYRLEMGEMA